MPTSKRDANEIYMATRPNDRAAELLLRFQNAWKENSISATATEQTALIAAFTTIVSK